MPALQVSANDRMGPGLAVGGSDLADHGVGIVDLALSQRSPSLDLDVVLGQQRTGLDLLELRVAFDLVETAGMIPVSRIWGR